MSKNEKAHFKKYAFKNANKTNSEYFKTFDIIDKFEDFNVNNILDNKNISKKFKQNVYVHLNILFKKVIVTLLEYKKQKSVEIKFFELYAEYELFLERKLYELAFNKIKNIEKLVLDNKMYYLKPFLYRKYLRSIENSTTTSKSDIELFRNKYKNSLKDIFLVGQINIINLKLDHIINKNGGLKIENKKDLKTIKKQKKIVTKILYRFSDDIHLSNIAYNVLYIIGILMNDIDSIQKLNKKYLKSFSKQFKILENEEIYFSSLNLIKNIGLLGTIFNNQKQYKASIELINEKIKSLKNKTIKDEIVFMDLYLKSLNYFFNNTNINATKLFIEIENAFKNTKPGTIKHMELIGSYCGLLIKNKQYLKSIEVSNSLFSIKYNNQFRDIYLVAKIIRTIAWYKVENIDLFYSEIRSIYRELLSNNTLLLKMHLIKFIRKIPKVITKKDKENYLKEIISSLDNILKDCSIFEYMKAKELKAIFEIALE